ncbi:MAG: HK97 family phage prohead protease [Actinomycetota bacterium]
MKRARLAKRKATPEQNERVTRLGRMDQEVRVVRAASPIEVRQSTSGGIEIEGYASTFDDVYILEDFFGEYEEVVAKGAFTKTLNDGADVRLTVNHDGLPLARTKSGTLELEEDDVGLLYRAPSLAADDPDVQRLVPKLEREDVAESSFMFRVIREDWYFSDPEDDEDLDRRTILEVKLYDVGPVTWPANLNTSIGLRSGAVNRELARELGPQGLEGLLVRMRSGQPLTSCDLGVARALLDEMGTNRRNSKDPAEADPPADPPAGDPPAETPGDEPTEGAEENEGETDGRDAPGTLSLDMAKRQVEVLELAGR